jgi:hypothetical protein
MANHVIPRIDMLLADTNVFLDRANVKVWGVLCKILDVA